MGIVVSRQVTGVISGIISGSLLAKQHRADRKLAVEPTSRLVQRLADEVGGELIGKPVRVGLRIPPLGKRHRTAVIPAVDHFGDPLHARTVGKGRLICHRVDVWFVNSQVVD